MIAQSNDGADRQGRTATRSGRASLDAEAAGASFGGLPDGMNRWDLLRAVRTAAPALAISSRELQYLGEMIARTYDVDWEWRSEPIVFAPLHELADQLGITERQIRNIERGLAAKGFLCWRDSGNRCRKGRRDRRSNRIIYAYGVSLAPLGARAAAIARTAEAWLAEMLERRKLRHAISAYRRRLRDLGAVVPQSWSRLPEGMPTLALTRVRDEMAAAVTTASAAQLRQHATDTARISSWAEIPVTPTLSTTIQESSRRRSPRNRANEPAAQDFERLDRMSGGNLAMMCAGADLDARCVWEAAGRLALAIGINTATWWAACAMLGRVEAITTVCAMAGRVSADSETRRVAHPEAYLASILRRRAGAGAEPSNSTTRDRFRAKASSPYGRKSPVKAEEVHISLAGRPSDIRAMRSGHGW